MDGWLRRRRRRLLLLFESGSEIKLQLGDTDSIEYTQWSDACLRIYCHSFVFTCGQAVSRRIGKDEATNKTQVLVSVTSTKPSKRERDRKKETHLEKHGLVLAQTKKVDFHDDFELDLPARIKKLSRMASSMG